MSKFRMLLAIPCFALSLALVGCGGGESDFQPVAPSEPVPDATSDYMSGKDPRGGGGAAKTPATGKAPAKTPEAGKTPATK